LANLPISIDDIAAFVFDFDGVLTNNLVHLDQGGKEWVSCSRADGLAFDVLRKLKKPAYILSTEKNTVVTARAKKLQVSAFQGVADKVIGLKELLALEGLDIQSIIYVGNDLNDFYAMQLCGVSACPADSHEKIKSIASIQLKKNGGDGVVRELLEDVIGLDFLKILYNK
jgi:3-deoxy-D-manno-octulosonate 8-phosphate phosphatase (KDO 8-P phosphatase)